MSRIMLTYDTAMADSRDAGNRSMRKGFRTAWNEDDYNASVDRLNHLTVVFYYANAAAPIGPVELPLACIALQETRGMNCIRH